MATPRLPPPPYSIGELGLGMWTEPAVAAVEDVVNDDVCEIGGRGAYRCDVEVAECEWSSDGRAGVERPDALIDGCRLRPPPAAAARSADACEWPASGTAWAPRSEALSMELALVDGVVMLRFETLDEPRRREGIGCVEPVIWCVGLGSVISTGSKEGVLAALLCDALLATEAECWARRAESSRVRRLTCVTLVSSALTNRASEHDVASCFGLSSGVSRYERYCSYLRRLPALSQAQGAALPQSRDADAA